MKRIRNVFTGLVFVLVGITALSFAAQQNQREQEPQQQNRVRRAPDQRGGDNRQAPRQPDRQNKQDQQDRNHQQPAQRPQPGQRQPVPQVPPQPGQNRQPVTQVPPQPGQNRQPSRQVPQVPPERGEPRERVPQVPPQTEPGRAQRGTPRSGQQPPREAERSQDIRREQARRGIWERERARNWEREHRSWSQRGGYAGYRIPDDRYRRYFGPAHPFRIYRYPVIVVGGRPRFQYEGFWFVVLDPWPEYWAPDWFDNDDVFVLYSDDGYYLCNRMYPQDRIAISISVN